MEIFELLKDLKNIEADPDYLIRSRAELLTRPPKVRNGAWNIFVSALQSGSAIALTGLFLLLLLGGFSITKLTSFFGAFGSLQRGALTVEAQAVDIQIQLADLNYKNTPRAQFKTAKGVTGGISTLEGAAGAVTGGTTPSEGSSSAAAKPVEIDNPTPVPNGTSTEPAPQPVGIDQALQVLSE